MKYLLIIGHDDSFRPSGPLISRIVTWNKQMLQKKVLLDSNPLRPWNEAKTIRATNGKLDVVPGSFSDSAEKISAYALVTCATESEAIEIARSHPMATEAVVEVRPVWEGLAAT
jgi:hypothetical protein